MASPASGPEISGYAGELYYAYLSIARELNAELAPVGIAWEREVQQDSTQISGRLMGRTPARRAPI
jgi:hypothetical protein